MNDQTTDHAMTDDDNAVEALEALKRKAATLGVKYSPNIGIDTLRARINAALASTPEDKDDEAETDAEERPMSRVQREAKLRKDVQDEQMRLVRIRITNMNPQKKDHHGEIFTVANKFLGIVKKYVPYGEASEAGYHVPYCIYVQLKDRKFQQIKTKTVNGQIQVESRWVPEFAIEELEPLTERELNQLRLAQAAAAGQGE